MRIAVLAILTLLPGCSSGERGTKPVDIDRAAAEAQADIDNYAAQRAIDEDQSGRRRALKR